jgi:hypothetical protein
MLPAMSESKESLTNLGGFSNFGQTRTTFCEPVDNYFLIVLIQFAVKLL